MYGRNIETTVSRRVRPNYSSDKDMPSSMIFFDICLYRLLNTTAQLVSAFCCYQTSQATRPDTIDAVETTELLDKNTADVG